MASERELRAAASADRPAVALCTGKDCRRRSEFAALRGDLDESCEVIELPCVKVCSGPVVVVEPVGDEPVVYAKIRTKKHRRQLLRLVVNGIEPGSALAQREVRKSKRTTVLRNLDDALTG